MKVCFFPMIFLKPFLLYESPFFKTDTYIYTYKTYIKTCINTYIVGNSKTNRGKITTNSAQIKTRNGNSKTAEPVKLRHIVFFQFICFITKALLNLSVKKIKFKPFVWDQEYFQLSIKYLFIYQKFFT